MISDAPYEDSDLLLSPLQGGAAGCLAGTAMLGAYLALGRHSLVQAGEALAGPFLSSSWQVGLGAQMLVAMALGTLYGLCQLRTRPACLPGVGLFYGFFLYVLTRLLALIWKPGRDLVSSSGWLMALLCFGLTLGLLGLAASQLASGKRRAVAID